MSQKNNTDAGSRMHVLDWVESRGEDFVSSLNRIIQVSGARVSPGFCWKPHSRRYHEEALLTKPCEPLLPVEISRALRKWWFAVDRSNPNEPNWDLAVHVTFPNARPAIVLAEAKAHEDELQSEEEGKSPGNNPMNHEQIGRDICEARDALGGSAKRVNISRDSHYQFSNCIAFAWKLAKEGVPMVLIYLGFTGDEGITDLSPCIRDDAHWRDLMKEHMDGIYPASLLEQEISCGKASMWVLIRTLKSVRMSPPQSERKQLV